MVLKTKDEYIPGNPFKSSINNPSSSTMSGFLTILNAFLTLSSATSIIESDWISLIMIFEKRIWMFFSFFVLPSSFSKSLSISKNLFSLLLAKCNVVNVFSSFDRKLAVIFFLFSLMKRVINLYLERDLSLTSF